MSQSMINELCQKNKLINSSNNSAQPSQKEAKVNITSEDSLNISSLVKKNQNFSERGECAVKKINLNFTISGIQPLSLREKNIVSSLVHPNIIQLINVNESSSGSIDLYYESFDSTLSSFIEKNKSNTEIYTMNMIKRFMRQILNALCYIHSRKIIHRDINPENLYLKDSKIKIANFELCSISNFGCQTQEQILESFVVTTLPYRAPELIGNKNNANANIDLWSVGCVFAELLLKRPLFNFKLGKCNEKILQSQMMKIFGETCFKDLKNKGTLNKVCPLKKECGIKKYILENSELINNINDSALDLIDRLLQIEPNKRISSAEALQHVRKISLNLNFFQFLGFF